MVFSPTQVGTAVCQCLAALAAGGAGPGRAPGTLPAAHMDGSTAVASPAPWCLVRGAMAVPKPTVPVTGEPGMWHHQRELFPGSAIPC